MIDLVVEPIFERSTFENIGLVLKSRYVFHPIYQFPLLEIFTFFGALILVLFQYTIYKCIKNVIKYRNEIHFDKCIRKFFFPITYFFIGILQILEFFPGFLCIFS